MPKANQITVTIAGPQGSGKTILGNTIRDMLVDVGARFISDETCDNPDSLWQLGESQIRIVEVQT